MIKKAILFLGFGLLASPLTLAQNQCFLAQEKDNIMAQEGSSTVRYAPCSTFKIPLSFIRA